MNNSSINDNINWTDQSTTMTATTIGDNYYDQKFWVGDPIEYHYPYTVNVPSIWTCPEEKPTMDDIEKFVKKTFKEREKENKVQEDIMYVFEVTVVDKIECEILHEQKVIAKDQNDAMIELDLTPEIKKQVKKGEIEFIFKEVGDFTKIEKKVRLKDVQVD